MEKEGEEEEVKNEEKGEGKEERGRNRKRKGGEEERHEETNQVIFVQSKQSE